MSPGPRAVLICYYSWPEEVSTRSSSWCAFSKCQGSWFNGGLYRWSTLRWFDVMVDDNTYWSRECCGSIWSSSRYCIKKEPLWSLLICYNISMIKLVFFLYIYIAMMVNFLCIHWHCLLFVPVVLINDYNSNRAFWLMAMVSVNWHYVIVNLMGHVMVVISQMVLHYCC